MLAAALGIAMLLPAGTRDVQAAVQTASAVVWSGSGTESSPYLIGTADDLTALADYINSGKGSGRKVWFEQRADIDLSGISKWTPIGTSSLVFSGVYKGNGYEITGMKSEGTTLLGLFGHIAEAELYDIHVSGTIDVKKGIGQSGYRANGGIVGQAGSNRTIDSADPKTNVISGCISEVEISSALTGNGGIVGQTTSDTEITNCLYKGTIRLEESGDFYAQSGSAGILGDCSADGTISGCVNEGSIINTGNGDTAMGGIVGSPVLSAVLLIENCYNVGTIKTNGTYGSVGAGGIIGKRTNWWDKNNTSYGPYAVTIRNCYNAGNVTAPNKDNANTGGIIGYTLSADSYGDAVITDENTSHVYSLSKSAKYVICADGNRELRRTLSDAGIFYNTATEDGDGIPWLLAELGDPFKADTNYVNNGYPLLGWQTEGEALSGENGRVAVSVTYDTEINRATGSEPLVKIDGEIAGRGAQVLSAGIHTYEVSEEGYQTASGSFSVDHDLENVRTVSVVLTAERYPWVISVVPADADLTVFADDGSEMTPEECKDGSYTYALYNGDYTISASADGYFDAEDARHGVNSRAFSVRYGSGACDLSLNEIPETAPQEPAMEDGYYLIYTPQELSWINEQSASIDQDTATKMAGANIRLMADIDMAGYDWFPMNGKELAGRINSGHYSGGCYTGIFDGNGHVISNLTVRRENLAYGYGNVDRTDAVGGLFGYTKGAEIKNVGLQGTMYVSDAPDSSAGDYCHIGGIVGMAQSCTTITGCYSRMDITMDVTLNESGKKVGAYYASDTYIGGIAGSLTTGSVVTDCYSAGTLSGEGTHTVNIGGIAGSTRGDYHEYDDATNEIIFEQQNQIIRCYSYADISSDPYGGTTSYIGGIVGMVRSAAVGKIPEIYCNFALNETLAGSGAGAVEANRVLGNTDTFEDSGYYNYAKDTLQIVNAVQNGTEENAQNSYGIDIAQADAVLAGTYRNVGWQDDVWNLEVLNDYPRLAWEQVEKHIHTYREEVTPPTCYEYGYTTYTCTVCGETTKGNFTNPGAHEFGDWEESTERTNSHSHTCKLCGYVEVKTHTWGEWELTKAASVTEPGEKERVCDICGASETGEIPKLSKTNPMRIYGNMRYDTSTGIADAIMKANGGASFDAVIITTGQNYADALSGSYLAKVKNAPILLVDPAEKQIPVSVITDYIKANMKADGTVYILGGTSAVPETAEENLSDYTVKRLGGENRYETNLLILEEAGVASEDLLVCTGKNFADSLSASAAGKPILLVDGKLNDRQMAWLTGLSGSRVDIIGGTSAVGEAVEEQLKAYVSDIRRLAGADRYETSALVAKTYFDHPSEAILAVGSNFPDGLCGSALALTEGAPLLLAAETSVQQAEKYCKDAGVSGGYVLGGPGLISDRTAKQILQVK